ncbi:hypothetical protein CHUAL_013740 [Chamberlinius hualienensis]
MEVGFVVAALKMSWKLNWILLIFIELLHGGQTTVNSVDDKNCHWEVNATQSQTIKPTAKDLRGEICTWSIRSSGENEMLNISQVVNFFLSNRLTVVIDDKSINDQCLSVNCHTYGRHIKVTYVLNNFDSSVNDTYFVFSYDVLSLNECPTPQEPLNGRIARQTGRKIGDTVVYACNSPYIIKSNEPTRFTQADCQRSQPNSIVPSWNDTQPVCVIPQCSKTPVKIEIDGTEEMWIVNPSYPNDFTTKKPKICSWESILVENEHKVLQVTLVDIEILGKDGTLEIYDGKIRDSRLLTAVRDSSAQDLVVSAVSNRILIQLVFENKYTVDKDPLMNTKISFKIKLSAVDRICSRLSAPVNGDLRGIISHNQGVFYICNEGYYMDGSEKSFCSEEGEWNSTAPLCVIDEFSISKVTVNQPSTVQVPDVSNTTLKFEESRNISQGDYDSGGWEDQYPEEEAEIIDVFDSQITYADDEEEEEKEDGFQTKLAVYLGVGIPVGLGLLGAISFAVYRKLYPVRMSMGRKFGTYENPVYESRKRNTVRISSNVSAEARSPAELHRLTTHNSP